MDQGIVILKEFRDFLKKESLLDSKDYHLISKKCKATRHHIKNVIESNYNTNQNTYDAIIEFYGDKKRNLDIQKQIVKTKDFASQI